MPHSRMSHSFALLAFYAQLAPCLPICRYAWTGPVAAGDGQLGLAKQHPILALSLRECSQGQVKVGWEQN